MPPNGDQGAQAPSDQVTETATPSLQNQAGKAGAFCAKKEAARGSQRGPVPGTGLTSYCKSPTCLEALGGVAEDGGGRPDLLRRLAAGEVAAQRVHGLADGRLKPGDGPPASGS